VDRELREEVYDVEGEERVAALLPVRGDDAVVPPKVSRRETGDLRLKLQPAMSDQNSCPPGPRCRTSSISAGHEPHLNVLRCLP
jgi:hypothetical protein